jgi:hypothetical protein
MDALGVGQREEEGVWRERVREREREEEGGYVAWR